MEATILCLPKCSALRVAFWGIMAIFGTIRITILVELHAIWIAWMRPIASTKCFILTGVIPIVDFRYFLMALISTHLHASKITVLYERLHALKPYLAQPWNLLISNSLNSIFFFNVIVKWLIAVEIKIVWINWEIVIVVLVDMSV